MDYGTVSASPSVGYGNSAQAIPRVEEARALASRILDSVIDLSKMAESSADSVLGCDRTNDASGPVNPAPPHNGRLEGLMQTLNMLERSVIGLRTQVQRFNQL